MSFLKKSSGAFFLTASFLTIPMISNRNLDNRTQTIFVEYNIDKDEADLKCNDIAKIHLSDFIFYSCKEDLDFSLVSKIEYIDAVKKYAKEKLGMKQTSNYKIYKNHKTDFSKTEYRLYVTPEFIIPQRLENWEYIEKRGNYEIDIDSHTIFYSGNEEFISDETSYKSRGYDTVRQILTDFSGGCDLNPNFFSKNLDKQADLVLHEDWHETIKHLNLNRMLDESIATLIGKVGAINFTSWYFGEDSNEHKKAINNLMLWVDFSEKIVKYNFELQELYGNNIPRDQKLMMKKEMLSKSRDVEMNNSYIWAYLPYTKNFLLVYEIYKGDQNIDKLLEIIYNIPKNEKDGIKYLEDILKK